jgi:hypothetical protein
MFFKEWGPDTVEIIRTQHCHGAGDGNAAPLFNVEEAFYKSEPRTSYMLHAESGLFQPVNSPPPKPEANFREPIPPQH